MHYYQNSTFFVGTINRSTLQIQLGHFAKITKSVSGKVKTQIPFSDSKSIAPSLSH